MVLRVVLKYLWEVSETIQMGQTLLRLDTYLSLNPLFSLSHTESNDWPIAFTPKSGLKARKKWKPLVATGIFDISELLKISSLDHLFSATLEGKKVSLLTVCCQEGMPVLLETGFFKTQSYIWKIKQVTQLEPFTDLQRDLTSQVSINIDFL